MLQTIIAYVLLHAQNEPFDKGITFTAPANTIKRVLSDLSQKTGEQLTVSGDIAKDIIVLQFNNVTTRDAMAKVAAATTAEWKPTDDGFQLVRTPAVAERYRAATRGRFVPFLRKHLDKLATEFKQTEGANEAQVVSALSQISDWDDDSSPANLKPTALDEAILQQTPGARFLLRLARNIGVARLATIAESGKRAVFALPATPRQQPIEGLEGAIDAYQNEHNLWAIAASQISPRTLENRWRVGHYHPSQQTVLRNPFSKIFVTVQSGLTPGDTLRLEMKAFDAAGNWVDEDYLELQTGPPYNPDSPDEENAKRDPEPPIELSHDAEILSNYLDISLDEKAPIQDQALIAKLCKPDRFEPLSLMASEIMLKTADAKHENLAACLPDDAFSDMAVLADVSSLKPTWILRLLPSRGDVCTEQNGWIVCHPENPFESTQKRASRPAISRLIDAGLKNKRLTIDDWAAYALECPEDYVGLGQSILDCTAKNDRFDDIIDWDSARLFGSFTTQQRLMLDSGGRLSFREMTDKQRAIVDKIAGDNICGASIDPDPNPEAKDVRHVLEDPSELLPNGVDAGGFLEMTTTSEDKLYRVHCKETEGCFLGIQDFFRFAPEYQPTDGPSTDPGHLQPATEMRRDFRLSVAPGRVCHRFLSESYAPPGPQYTLASLPAKIKKELAEAIDEMRKNPPIDIGGSSLFTDR